MHKLSKIITCIVVIWLFSGCKANPMNKFLEVRLFELVQLVLTLGLGAIIAFYFSKRLNDLGKKQELILQTINQLERVYAELKDVLGKFMKDPKSVETEIITLKFKSISARLSILETYSEKIKVPRKKINNLKGAVNNLEKLITGKAWSDGLKNIKYDVLDIHRADKEFENIEHFIEDMKFSIFM